MSAANRLTVRNALLWPLHPLKHDIHELRLPTMVRETQAYGLPSLQENPFSIRPLEAGESGKLVGRSDVFNRMKTYLQLGTARKVMLLGPLGSGRTSLARCLKPYAGAYATIDHLPAQTPAASLLSMCYRQMIGGEPPSNRMDLVNGLVNEMYGHQDKLPMIVIDVPASDLSVLEVALRDAHSSLERLNALLVLVCDVKERHHLPPALLEGFEVQRLSPFNASDVLALVRQRLASVGVMDSEFSMHDATNILEDCDGFPAPVITILRDAVDAIRMNDVQGLPTTYVDTSARILPRDEPDMLDRLMEPEPTVQKHEERAPYLPSFEENEPTELIDASMPWDQRPPLQSNGNEQAPAESSPLPASSFDLDFVQLDDDKDNDEPLQPTPFHSPIIDADEAIGAATTNVKGMFKSLAQRNKESNQGLESDGEVKAGQHELISAASGHQYWVDESLLTPTLPMDIPEAESALMIHDEIGLVEPPEDAGLDVELDLDEPPFESPTPEPLVQSTSADEMLQALVGVLQSSPAASSNREALLSFFEQRYHRGLGPKESYDLNPAVLGRLNSGEAYVVAIAQERAYSPSDTAMLEHLGIKRARLSQISSRLLKNGILQVRQAGRSRKYNLTQAARAQLIAWGALKAGDAP